ncbi:DUF433 domain-containing protein [bacterium]|nr:DUF433 domain-containing protein [bacterium]
MSQKASRPAELGRYSIPEAARYLRIPPATLRSWVVGREYPTAAGPHTFKPIIRIADGRQRLLSFENLIEAHVLSALRGTHQVRVQDIRNAIRYVERDLGISRLLLSPELKAAGGRLFIERYGELMNVAQSGQLAMRAILEGYLERVTWKNERLAAFYPFIGQPGRADARSILISPDLAFGRPVVARRIIATAVITDRFDAGESIAALAADYGLEAAEIEAAIIYEQAA